MEAPAAAPQVEEEGQAAPVGKEAPPSEDPQDAPMPSLAPQEGQPEDEPQSSGTQLDLDEGQAATGGSAEMESSPRGDSRGADPYVSCLPHPPYPSTIQATQQGREAHKHGRGQGRKRVPCEVLARLLAVQGLGAHAQAQEDFADGFFEDGLDGEPDEGTSS